MRQDPGLSEFQRSLGHVYLAQESGDNEPRQCSVVTCQRSETSPQCTETLRHLVRADGWCQRSPLSWISRGQWCHCHHSQDLCSHQTVSDQDQSDTQLTQTSHETWATIHHRYRISQLTDDLMSPTQASQDLGDPCVSWKKTKTHSREVLWLWLTAA